MNDDYKGYISIDEIHNVMTEFMTKLDQEVMPVGYPFHRPSVIHHCDCLRLELQKRCKRSLSDLAKLNPELARQIDISTRISGSDKPLSEQVREAQETIARARAPTLEEQLQNRRSLGKEVARREAMGLDPQSPGRRK